MLEKTSIDVKCHKCDKPAVKEIAGVPCCADCIETEKVSEAVELQKLFDIKQD